MTDHFPFQYPIEIIFRDLDAMGHVNNAVYFTYMETARVKCMMELFNITHLKDMSLIVAEATCTYKSPAHFGETLMVGIAVARMGNKSFDLLYRIETDDGRLVAEAKTVQVVFDYAAQKTIAIPDDFRARVTERQQGWQPPA